MDLEAFGATQDLASLGMTVINWQLKTYDLRIFIIRGWGGKWNFKKENLRLWCRRGVYVLCKTRLFASSAKLMKAASFDFHGNGDSVSSVSTFAQVFHTEGFVRDSCTK